MKKIMKNVVFYTHRLAFISNWIMPLSEHIDAQITILHINSLNKESYNLGNVPKNFKVIDISYRSYKSILKIIKKLNPSVFINFNFRSPYEIFITKSFKNSNIKTIYIEHGLYSNDTVKTHIRKNLLNIFKHTLFKNIVFLTRLTELLINSRDEKLQLFRMYKKAFLFGDYNSFTFDKFFLLGNYSFEKLSTHFKLDNSKIQISGLPLFHTKQQSLEFSNTYDQNIDKTVLYIHQPFILDNLSKISYNDETIYLYKIKQLTEKNNLKFKVLLHPREDLSKYKLLYPGIEIIQKPNDFTIFFDITCAIGHYSTALFYPLYFGHPTIILDYPDIKCDSIFNELGEYLGTIENLSDNFRGFTKSKEKPRNNLNRYIGEQNSFENVAFLINKEI